MKPYSIQSPQDIAQEYGGNKQKIAQAMQQGLVDPTAGVLAGMFVDRMQTAQAGAQSMQPTVAQQVFSPAPPARSPEGSQMAAPNPQPQPPQMMAQGGLAMLPYAGNYADGGIVGYAEGGETREEELARLWNESKYYKYRKPTDEKPRDLTDPTLEDVRDADIGLGDRLLEILKSGKDKVMDFAAGDPELNKLYQDSDYYNYSKPEDRQPREFDESMTDAAVGGLGAIKDFAAGDPEINQLYQDSDYYKYNRAEPDNINLPNYLMDIKENGLGLRDIAGAPGAAAAYLMNPNAEDNPEILGPPQVEPEIVLESGKDFAGEPSLLRKGFDSLWPVPPNAEDNPELLKRAADETAKVAMPTREAEPEAGLGSMAPSAPTAPTAGVTGFVDEAGAVSPEKDGIKEYRDFLKNQRERLENQSDKDFWSNVATFGFNMAGSDKPTLYQAAGEAGSKVMPIAQKQIEGRRAQEQENIAARAGLDYKDLDIEQKRDLAELSRQTQLDVASLYKSGMEQEYLDAMRRGDTATMKKIEGFLQAKTSQSSGYKFAALEASARTEAAKMFQQEYGAGTPGSIQLQKMSPDERDNFFRRYIDQNAGAIMNRQQTAAPQNPAAIQTDASGNILNR